MKTRYRSNWRGKLILQVSYVVDVSSLDYPVPKLVEKWRDATIEDLQLLMNKEPTFE